MSLAQIFVITIVITGTILCIKRDHQTMWKRCILNQERYISSSDFLLLSMTGEHQAAVQELTTSGTISSTKEPIDLICFVLLGSILHYRLSFIDYRPITVAMYHVLNLLFRAVSLTYLLVLDKYRIILSL